ncbi:MAG: hypothetical protein ACW98K_15945 [Candidatus Kariarchaeaceae archaeon]
MVQKGEKQKKLPDGQGPAYSQLTSSLSKLAGLLRIDGIINRTKNKWDFYRGKSASGLKSKEKMAAEFLFMRFPGQELIILSAFLFGPIAFMFSSTSVKLNGVGDYQIVHKAHDDLINNYLLWIKVPLIIMLSLFLTYRWSKIQREGDYGYWLSLGTSRSYFFFHTVSGFISNVYLGILLGFILVLYPGGIDLTYGESFELLLLLLSSTILTIGVAIFCAEIIRIPEFAYAAFISIFGVNLLFNRGSENLLSVIFLSEFQFDTDNVILAFFLSLFIGFVFCLGALYFHQKRDVEI